MTTRSRFSFADGLILAILMIIYYLVNVKVFSGDSFLAWPITDSIMNPGHYSPDDLIVRAGVEGNFLLYRLLALFPYFRDNFPLRDFLLYIPIFYLYLVAWWFVFTELGASRQISALAIALLLFSDGKLGLNWSLSPFPNLLSASSVQFIQVYCLYLFLAKKRYLALGLTAATGYLHPATALSFAAVYSAIIGLDAFRQKKLKVLAPVLLFAAIYLPNAFLILQNSQGAFTVTEKYHRIFEVFSYHTYLEYHFRMGYAYTLALIFFLYYYFSEDQPSLRHRNELFRFIGFGLLGSAFWLLNLYSVKILQITHVFFIMRIFYLIKPLVIYLVVITTARMFYEAKSKSDYLAASLIFMTPFFFSPSVALIVVAGCVVSVTGRKWWPLLIALLLLVFALFVIQTHPSSVGVALRYFNADHGGNEFNSFQVAVLAMTVYFVFRFVKPGFKGGNTFCFSWKTLLFLVLLLALPLSIPAKIEKAIRNSLRGRPHFDFNAKNYWGVRKAEPEYAALLDWAKASPYRMFAIPPYDDRFLSFRYLTGKGIYGQQWDLPQLAYSPKYYYTGYDRLVQLGLDPERQDQFDRQWNYDGRCNELIDKIKADVIVFEKKFMSVPLSSKDQPVFENAEFIAYRTHSPL